MFPYVPYLYPLMLLLCKQMIVFPLPSVSVEKDTALRSFSVLLINGVCRQLGWSLSYIVSITIIPSYVPLTFVFLSPLRCSNLNFLCDFLSVSQSDKVTRTCRSSQKAWSHFIAFLPPFLVTPSYQCMLLQEGSGQPRGSLRMLKDILEDKPQVSYGHREICVRVGVWIGGDTVAFGGKHRDNFLGIHTQS